MKVLCQKDYSSAETRAVKLHCLMQSPAYVVRNAAFEDLSGLSLAEFDLIVGSVEFLTRCFEFLDVKTPKNLSYPESLNAFLRREVQVIPEAKSLCFAEENKPCFLKPVVLKAFTGFVCKGLDFK